MAKKNETRRPKDRPRTPARKPNAERRDAPPLAIPRKEDVTRDIDEEE